MKKRTGGSAVLSAKLPPSRVVARAAQTTLRAIELEVGAKETREAVSRGSATSRARKQARKATRALESLDQVPNRSTEMFRHVICPIDRAKLRIPAGKKRVAVRCPKCSYSFIADSTLDDPEVSTKKKSGWFGRSKS